MKKRKHWYLVWIVSILILSGCANSGANLAEDKLNVATSFYPMYDITRNIGGEYVHVVNLVPAGVDSHDWTPKSRDVAQIMESDLFIYNGAGFEGWVEDVLKSIDSDSGPIVMEASHGINLIKANFHEDEHAHEEESHEDHAHEKEAQDEHAHEDHAHEEEGHTDSHQHGNYDPHVWLSPKRTMELAANIKDGLIQADPENQSEYEANYHKYIEQLESLDEKLKKVISEAKRKDIVVSHHAYAYLAEDYGLRQVAVMGLSPNAEPTVREMKEISEYIKQRDVKYILFEELVSPKLAETLANDLKIETLVFNPLEGLTETQIKAGENYISIMEKNIQTLEKALQL